MTAVDETAWMDRAACKGATSVMFPGPGVSNQPALDLCETCPVLGDCRRWIAHPDQSAEWNGVGVWAGMSQRERRTLGRRGAARILTGDNPATGTGAGGAACGGRVGSLAGVTRHRRAGEKPCRACTDAYNGHRRGRRSARAQEAVA